MTYDYSVVLILPAALQDKGNRVSCALGHDVLPGHTYSVELVGSDGSRFFGCHTWARPEFVDLLVGASRGVLPPVPWSDYGLTEADVAEVLSALIASPRADAAAAHQHWSEVLTEHGLTEMQEEI